MVIGENSSRELISVSADRSFNAVCLENPGTCYPATWITWLPDAFLQ